MPNLDVLLKIEIPQGALNPVVLRFKRCDVNGERIVDELNSLSFYASFETRRPNINNCDYTMRNANKILIKDPTKSNKDMKEFT